MKKIGEQLHMRRLEAGFSLRKLAELSGVDHSYIAKIEKGANSPSVDTLRGLCDVIGVEILLGKMNIDEREDI